MYPNLSNAHMSLGLLRAQAGDLAAALEHFDRAIACKPTHAASYLSRSEVKHRLGDTAGATVDFQCAARYAEDLVTYDLARKMLDLSNS